MTSARKRAIYALLVVAALGSIALLWIASQWRVVPSGEEAVRAHEVGDHVRQHFASRSITLTSAAVGSQIHLEVHGPDAKGASREICSFVSALRKERSLPRVRITFYADSTSWTETPD